VFIAVQRTVVGSLLAVALVVGSTTPAQAGPSFKESVVAVVTGPVDVLEDGVGIVVDGVEWVGETLGELLASMKQWLVERTSEAIRYVVENPKEVLLTAAPAVAVVALIGAPELAAMLGLGLPEIATGGFLGTAMTVASELSPVLQSTSGTRLVTVLRALPATVVSNVASDVGVRIFFQTGSSLWTKFDDGCDTRTKVLVNSALPASPIKKATTKVLKNAVPATCTNLKSLKWVSPYDGKKIKDPKDLDIDHVVSLDDAWKSGADKWTDEQRRAFANDQQNLLAVSSQSNRAKQAKGPATFLSDPKVLPEAHCLYAATYVATKLKYGLSIAQADREAVEQVLPTC
jgi:hypothetical protein